MAKTGVDAKRAQLRARPPETERVPPFGCEICWSSRKNSCAKQRNARRESSRKLGTKDHGIQRNSTHRDAMLCYALGWLSVDMPSPFWNKFCDQYENWRPSRRKRWEGYGNGRCAHRRINHTRAGSRPGRRGRAFFGFQKSPRNKKQEMQRSLHLLKGGDLSLCVQKKSNRFVCGVFRVPVIRGVSGNSYTNI